MLRTRRLVTAELRVELLTESVKGLQDSIQKLLTTNGEMSATISTHGAMHYELLRANKELRDKCAELAEHIKRMQEVPTQFASGPLWMSEEEEEARYRHANGDINGLQLREELEALGLDPEITME